MKLKDIIKQTIDIHFHIGPEIIPRKYTVQNFVDEESGKIAGAVLKNHFYPTQPFIKEMQNKKGMKLFGGVTLNNSVGGMNPEIIYTSSLLADKPIMVWFPTINAENFLRKSEFEIAPEWVKQKEIIATKAKDVKPIIVTRNGKVTKEAIEVLRMIKKCNAVLATGHIAWKESVLLVDKAGKMGIKKIVITHPIYQKIDMPISTQKALAKRGCFIEQSYSMYAIDKIPIAKIAKQIKDIGSKSIILSSDVGQTFSPPPSSALLRFFELLENEGITQNELVMMAVKNPRRLLGID